MPGREHGDAGGGRGIRSSRAEPVSQLAGDHPALAVAFPGEVAYGHETSPGKAIKVMCV